MSGLVTVGIDGSEHGERAIVWAAEEAVRRDAGLRVVYVLEWPMQLAEGFHTPHTREAMVNDAQLVVDRAVEQAQDLAPSIAVEGWLDVGHVAGTLVERSREAELLVVGAHGGGRVTGRLIGSTTSHLLSHSHCTMVVVRSMPHPGARKVVVGVDDTDTSKLVLNAACAEAELRHAPVELLHCYAWPVAPTGATWVTPLYPTEELQEEEQLLLAEASAGARADHPDLDMTLKVVCEPAGPALISASADAALVVVGSRGRGGFVGMLVGSVARNVAHHAECPVMVVRI
jgi:nucleotide-binding universal stress UspA family protein